VDIIISQVFHTNIDKVIADPRVNLNNIGPGVQGTKVDNLNYGTLQVEKREVLELGNVGVQEKAK
jgi:hypothetical protein